MIGDRISSDITGATNFGIDSVLVTNNQSHITNSECTYAVSNLKQLENIF